METLETDLNYTKALGSGGLKLCQVPNYSSLHCHATPFSTEIACHIECGLPTPPAPAPVDDDDKDWWLVDLPLASHNIPQPSPVTVLSRSRNYVSSKNLSQLMHQSSYQNKYNARLCCYCSLHSTSSCCLPNKPTISHNTHLYGGQ